MRVRSLIRYPKFVSCFNCGLPQDICDGWQRGVECPYGKVVLAMVAMMLFGPFEEKFREHWHDSLHREGVDVFDERSVMAFLGGKAEGQAYMEHTNLSLIFCTLRSACLEAEKAVGVVARIHKIHHFPSPRFRPRNIKGGWIPWWFSFFDSSISSSIFISIFFFW